MQNLQVKTECKSSSEASPTVGGRQVTVNAERAERWKDLPILENFLKWRGALGLEIVERSAIQKQVESFQSGPFKVRV